MYTLIRIGYQPGGAFIQSANGHVPADSALRHRVSLNAGIFTDDLISTVENTRRTSITTKRNTTLIILNEHMSGDGVYLVYCPCYRKLALYDDVQNVILSYYESCECQIQANTVGDFLAAKLIIT